MQLRSTATLGGLLLGLAGLISGCAYKVQPASTRAINIYSSYDGKIPGRFAVVLDERIRNERREIKPVTYVCGAHTYPVSLGDSIAVSLKHTLDQVFEETVERSSMPASDTMADDDLRGVVLVRLDEFSPRISCYAGFWSGTCVGTTDISFGVVVRGVQGTLFATSVAGSKTVDGSAGAFCDEGAMALADSITGAMKDALERMAERLSNAPRLRSPEGR